MSSTAQTASEDRERPGRLAMLIRRRRRGFNIFLVIIVAILAYVAGLYTLYRDLTQTRLLVQGLQGETQKARRELAAQMTAQGNLTAQLQKTKAELEAIRPSKDAFSISPNQSVVVGDGLLTIGLVGSPMNGSIDLNINGTKHTLATGDLVQLTPNGNTNCRVVVQSFDMFKAIVVASCSTPA